MPESKTAQLAALAPEWYSLKPARSTAWLSDKVGCSRALAYMVAKATLGEEKMAKHAEKISSARFQGKLCGSCGQPRPVRKK